MPARLGPRFAIEAGFLILLAVGAGLADLRPLPIVVVMAAGWLLVALVEWAAWREPEAPSALRGAQLGRQPEPPSPPAPGSVDGEAAATASSVAPAWGPVQEGALSTGRPAQLSEIS